NIEVQRADDRSVHRCHAAITCGPRASPIDEPVPARADTGSRDATPRGTSPENRRGARAMKWLIVLIVAARALATPATPQSRRPPAAVTNDTAGARFLWRVRTSTARYRDREQAVLDGYRPIGGDFPGMGEHWIDIGTLFSRTFTPDRPAILEYATIDGRPTLVGVAYALPLLPGEMPPALPGNVAWHLHAGTVADESDLLSQAMESHASMHGARLAMVHVWAWLPNPGGTFHAENWALPFVRAGVDPPPVDPGPVAGRVVSLLSGGDAFYEGVFLSVAGA